MNEYWRLSDSFFWEDIFFHTQINNFLNLKHLMQHRQHFIIHPISILNGEQAYINCILIKNSGKDQIKDMLTLLFSPWTLMTSGQIDQMNIQTWKAPLQNDVTHSQSRDIKMSTNFEKSPCGIYCKTMSQKKH